jgi:hypothetical protein
MTESTQRSGHLPDPGSASAVAKRLKFVQTYFRFAGIVTVLRLLLLLGLLPMAPDPVGGIANALPLPSLISWIASTIGFFLTAWLVGLRSRFAWIPTGLVFAHPFVLALVGVNMPMSSEVFAMAGLFILFAVRRDFDEPIPQSAESPPSTGTAP